MKYAMAWMLVLAVMCCDTAAARPRLFRQRRPVQTVVRTVAYAEAATAQGVANLMARFGRVGHFGGNPGYEGCGSGSTPQAAFNNCCYARSGMATVDVGYARGGNGMWYCCRRYR